MTITNKLLGLALIGAVATSCGGAPEGTEVDAQTAKEETTPEVTTTEYAVNTDASTIMWEGAKPTGKHTGTIGLASGTVNLEGDQLVGGEFTIDMTSIVNEDVEDEGYREKLVGHLSSAEFFDVETYPTGKFVITAVEAGNVTGNLTLKDQTNSITFPATVSVDSENVTMHADQFVIDRTQWGVDHDNLKDKLIDDKVGVAFHVTTGEEEVEVSADASEETEEAQAEEGHEGHAH